ncbi:MAG: hypothetical protein NUV48_07020 [Peptococcaceae bacterium]|jgi:Flp pilus assembly pilin Flp|nr:hypothetical protein [Peptococcaceae bacterium]
MRKVIEELKKVWKEESGVTIIEALLYGAVIATIAYVSVNAVGTYVKGGASNLGSSVSGKLTPTWS